MKYSLKQMVYYSSSEPGYCRTTVSEPEIQLVLIYSGCYMAVLTHILILSLEDWAHHALAQMMSAHRTIRNMASLTRHMRVLLLCCKGPFQITLNMVS